MVRVRDSFRMKKALLFGSIGAIVETSDIQRRAYNKAMNERGLPWVWDREIYAELLEQSGGKDRLAMLAAATGHKLTPVDIDAIHARKTELACQEITSSLLEPRAGVVALMRWAQERGIKTGFITTTYQANIDAIFTALAPALSPQDFDFIMDRDKVINGKPAPDAYILALSALAIKASEALVIEDTALSVMAAKRAGIITIATPGDISAGQDFWQADFVIEALADKAGAIDPHVSVLLNEA